MNKVSPKEWYHERTRELTAYHTQLSRNRQLLGWLRLIGLIAAFLIPWAFWSMGLIYTIPIFIFLISIFLFVVQKDLKNNRQIRNTDLLLKINEDESRGLLYDYAHFHDGEQLRPDHHPYCDDLDILGKASVYQFCNRSSSEQGKRLFADWLLAPSSREEIMPRQEAAKELGLHPIWRQQLQAYGMDDKISIKTEHKILAWLGEETKFIDKAYWSILQWLLPVLSTGSLALYLFGIMPAKWFYLAAFFFFAISLLTSKLVMPAYRQLNQVSSEMETLSNSIRHIENQQFHSTILRELKSCFQTSIGTASLSVKSLRSILNRLDYRLNPLVFIPLNTFLFWDIQQVMALEKWKKRNNQYPSKWFEALAQMESLVSLGTLHFNHPRWVFPTISKEEGIFVSEDLGHPLIAPDKRVRSNFSSSSGEIGLVTGSNMAGKSTFLRSVGVNIVLAMAGGPVCARSLELSYLKVMSSMRVRDNLEENTSTFYAELKKLKDIIEAVNHQLPIYLLLDEMLRGTNSADRHTGSAALIEQLVRHGATGLIATHDLELSRLAEQYPDKIHNYHFDVQVDGEELYFDYILKKGVCTSMNASILMKKIGIEIGQ